MAAIAAGMGTMKPRPASVHAFVRCEHRPTSITVRRVIRAEKLDQRPFSTTSHPHKIRRINKSKYCIEPVETGCEELPRRDEWR